MSVTVDINSTELVRFVTHTSKVQSNMILASSRALNKVGDQLVEDIITEIAEETGMEASIIRRKINVVRATPMKLMYRIDAASAVIDAPATRPMRGSRRFARKTDEYFQADELVDVITIGDEKVCHICEKIEEEGPYRIDIARTLIPAHPHCRCLVSPTQIANKKEMPVLFRRKGSVRLSDLTIEKLKQQLKDEVNITLRAT
jgi:hypothetical protein